MSSVISLDKKGRTTLPEDVRAELGLKAGDFLILEKTERGTYELVPASLVPNDQLWFHHPEMQRRIREAEASIASGHATRADGLAAAALRNCPVVDVDSIVVPVSFSVSCSFARKNRSSINTTTSAIASFPLAPWRLLGPAKSPSALAARLPTATPTHSISSSPPSVPATWIFAIIVGWHRPG
jgi:AbrB family looped-hinge helix DNA binding protein